MGVLMDFWKLRTFYLVPVFFLAAIPILTEIPSSEMPQESRRCLYVLVVMALTWLTESLPISATALFPMVLFPLMGVMTARNTSGAYLTDTSMLFLGGLIVAVAVEEWDLHKRIAIGVMMIVGSDPKWVMAGLMLPTWFLSMWISNTATASMMVPIAAAVLDQVKAVKTGVSNTAVNDFDAIPEDGQDPSGVVNNGFQGDDGKHYAMRQLNQNAQSRSDQSPPPYTSSPDQDPPGLARLTKGLTLCIAYAANIGGIATLTGTPPNLVMKGIADDYYKEHQPEDDQSGSPISFSNWMGLAVPLSAIVLVLGWCLLVLLFVAGRGCCTLDEDQSKAIKRTIRNEWRKLGPITLAQVILLVLFVFLAVMWVSRDPKESPGWSVWFEYKVVTSSGLIRYSSFPSDSTSAMLIAVLLFILPAKVPNICCWRTPERAKEQAYTPILIWEQVQRKLPWGVIVLLGGGFALAKGVEASKLSVWLADKLSSLDYLDKWVLNLSLCFIVAAATEVTSNTATATLLMPIMANLAKSLGYNPLYLMVSTTLATSFAFMLPVATPPNAIVFSYGAIRVKDMAFAGLFMNLIAVGTLTLGVNTWGVQIYDFDFFDPIFNKTLTG